MTNKEKYKQAFSVLHSSDDFILEVEKMMTIKKRTAVDVTFVYDPAGSYQISYQTEDGTIEEFGGGGVAIEDDGTERPLTESELLAKILQSIIFLIFQNSPCIFLTLHAYSLL